ncbi:MAG: hypothetical protein WAT22_02335 [Saprospiraceae bacterium]|nr:hypothetical protein [Saprospiraceae bacterium]MBK9567502.1 hypothetical protein [Saprospiraceae bacterium]
MKEVTRSPLIWVVPGLTPKNELCKRSIDFFINGLPIPAHVEGVSVTPLLKNPKANWNIPALITFKEGNHAVKSENYRYIKYGKGGEEFYDVIKDPYEWNSVISQKSYRPGTSGKRYKISTKGRKISNIINVYQQQ